MVRATAVFIIVLAALGCATGAPEPDPAAAAPPAPVGAAADHQHVLDVDWVPFSEEQIYRQAHAIVRGRVVAQRFGTHRTYPFDRERGRELTPEEAGDTYHELPLTTSILEVAEQLATRHPAAAPGASIEIVQLGGRYADGCWVEPTDQRLLRVDDEVVVYLKPAGMIPRGSVRRPDVFSIIGGQQGLVPIRGGSLEPMEQTVFARYAHRSVADLARDAVRLAVSSDSERER